MPEKTHRPRVYPTDTPNQARPRVYPKPKLAKLRQSRPRTCQFGSGTGQAWPTLRRSWPKSWAQFGPTSAASGHRGCAQQGCVQTHAPTLGQLCANFGRTRPHAVQHGRQHAAGASGASATQRYLHRSGSELRSLWWNGWEDARSTLDISRRATRGWSKICSVALVVLAGSGRITFKFGQLRPNLSGRHRPNLGQIRPELGAHEYGPKGIAPDRCTPDQHSRNIGAQVSHYPLRHFPPVCGLRPTASLLLSRISAFDRSLGASSLRRMRGG